MGMRGDVIDKIVQQKPSYKGTLPPAAAFR
jgi:hypothetical protein